jgi:hypothetical protein
MIKNFPKEIDITAFWDPKQLTELQDDYILKISTG